MDAQTLPDTETTIPDAADATAPSVAWRRPPVPAPRPPLKRLIVVTGLLALLLLGLFLADQARRTTPIFDIPPQPLLPSGPAASIDAFSGLATERAAYQAEVVAAPPAGATTQTTADDWGRKIIRNGQINLQVADVENSLAAVRNVAVQAGGLVFSTNSQYQGETLVASITLQVPVESFDQVMASLRRLGVKVLNETSSSQDVTEEYTDLTSQLKNQQAQEEQLRLLMSKATTVDETLTVQRELGQVRGAIEKIQGRMAYLDHHAALSSIVVNLNPQPVAAPVAAVAPTGWHPEVIAGQAWDASLTLLTTAGNVLIAVAVFSWWLVPLLLIGGLLLRRRGPLARAG